MAVSKILLNFALAIDKVLPLTIVSKELALSVFTNLGAVVQPVRIPACHAGGREFESRPHRWRERRRSGFSPRAMLLLLFVIYSPRAPARARPLPFQPLNTPPP